MLEILPKKDSTLLLTLVLKPARFLLSLSRLSRSARSWLIIVLTSSLMLLFFLGAAAVNLDNLY